MNLLRPVLSTLLSALAAAGPFAAVAPAQQDPEQLERLRRDQDEILRKAERLQALMQRLQQRYEREQKAEQVELLRAGLAHLERSGVLRDAASIRDDLAATAFSEALRKQKEVVDDLERLLNILLERKSIENLDQELKDVTERARSARELERRQSELQERTRDAMRTPPTPAEQALLDQLQQLRDAERREAERNARDAGTRRPFLESAMERVQQLLRDQQRLEQSIAEEDAGRAGETRARAFDLGELTERTRELQAELRDQGKLEALGASSADLQKEAAGADQSALQQARDRLEAQLQNPPKLPGTSEGKSRDPAWTEVKEQLRSAGAGATPAEREQLGKVAENAQKIAAERDRAATAANTAAGERLQKAAEQLAERLRGQEQGAPQEGTPAAAVEEARQHLAEAARANQADDTRKAQQAVNEALAALDRARALHQEQNPDATKKASEMAAESRATAQELQNAPSAAEAEQGAGEQLKAAEEALRAVQAAGEEPLGQPEASQPSPTTKADRQQAAATARQNLEAAQRTLEQALQQANAGGEQDMQAAAERQQQLEAAAKAAAEQIQQAAQSGAVQPQQASAAGERLQQAQQRMQDAAKKLQSGQQASAAQEQQAAAEALQEAAEALDQNRPLNAEQKQALEEQAKAQEELVEDIVKLAEELKARDNKDAQRKVQAAADAAKKAQRAMEQGEAEETQEQQEEARKNLEEAAKELEEEADRYQDLRQEELLFRMKEELTTFLDRQRPLTAAALDAQKSATAEGLSRAMRTKVNQIGEEELQLAAKLDFLVQALTEEGNLVYRTVLQANGDDLREVARRLAGRRPDVGTFTTLLQQDVERRSTELLEALERERKRREQERKESQQQQQQGKNRFNQQRQKLVTLIAELEMLKTLGTDTQAATENLRTLVDARGDDVITDAEVALIERLGHRHAEITKLFQQIKASVEQATQDPEEGQEGGSGR